MASSASPYASLHPADTHMWQFTASSSSPLQQVPLGLLSIVAVPLELIARIFYNIFVSIYTCLGGRIIQQETLPPTDTFVQPNLDNLEPLLSRIKGVFYGQAVGDALGVFTEFLTEPEARAFRRPNLEFTDRAAFARPHLNRFPVDGPTDDTDQALMIIRCEKEFLTDPSTSKEVYFARQLLNWRHHGLNGYSSISGLAFETREDPRSSDYQRAHISCQGIGAQTNLVLDHPQFAQNPHQAALDIWKRNNDPIAQRPAANGAIMRTALLGVIDTVRIANEAVCYAKVTHADPRSIASAVALACAIRKLVDDSSPSAALRMALIRAITTLREQMQAIRPYLIPAEQEQARFDAIVEAFDQELQACVEADLPALDLDEPGRIGYTFKCLGAAFYALRKAEALHRENPERAKSSIYREVIQEIIWQGGDADTNATVAGALVAAYLGIEAIPDSWKYSLHRRDRAVLEQSIAHANEV